MPVTEAPLAPRTSAGTRYTLLAVGATALGIVTALRSPAVPPLEFLLACAVSGGAMGGIQSLIPKRLIERPQVGQSVFFFLWWGLSGAVLLFVRQPR